MFDIYEQYCRYTMCNSPTGICYPSSLSFKLLVRLVLACNRTNLISQLFLCVGVLLVYVCKIEMTSIIGVIYLEPTT
jgi:hypothetical protein